jgi:hypothetical protein
MTDKLSRNCRAKRLNELGTQLNLQSWIHVPLGHSSSWERNCKNTSYRLRKKSLRRLQSYRMQSPLRGCSVCSCSEFNDW